MTPDDDYLSAISSMGLFNDDSTWLPEECDPNWTYSTEKTGVDSTTEVPSYECFLPWTDQPSTLAEINRPEVALRQSQNTNIIQSEIHEDPIENMLVTELDFANGLLDPEKNPDLSVEIDNFLQVLAKSDDLSGIHSNEEPLLVEEADVTMAPCHEQSATHPPVVTGSATKRNRRGRRSNANSSNEQFKCSYENCGRVYPKSSHLKMHLRRHTGEKPFHCPWEGCTWRFSRSDELNRHHRSHTGDKPYHCAICNKKFGRSDHLAKHKRVHERSAGQGYEILLPFGQPTQLPAQPEPPKRGRPRKDATRFLASRISRLPDSTVPQPIMPRPYCITA